LFTGGLLFAIEEVCSFYSSELLPHTLAACVAAVLADLLCRSGARALTSGAPFGWFDGDVIFEAGGSLYSHVLALVPAAGIGVLAGVLGGALNLLALVRGGGGEDMGKTRDPFHLMQPVSPLSMQIISIFGLLKGHIP
jgi:hypothetical protein